MRFVERLKRLVRYLRDKASKRIIRPPAMVESVLTAEEQDQFLKKSLVAEGVIEIPLMPPAGKHG